MRLLARLRWLLVATPPLATAAWVASPGPAAPAVASARAPATVREATPRREPVLAAAVHPPAPQNRAPRAPSVAHDPEPPSSLPAAPPRPPVEPEPAVTYGHEFFFGPSQSNKVALTFDDGPSAELTPWVLNTLRRHGVHATFFVLGHRASKFPELVEAIDAAGHEVGSHGWSHRSLRSLGPEEIEAELDDTSKAIVAATGTPPTLFRPPFGRYAPSAVELVAARGMDLVLWNADGRDWDGDADAVVQRVVSQARPGAIILLHDRETATARALPRILSGLQSKGLEIVPVSELLGLDVAPPTSESG
ncbi:MAG: polysaccharide deacetylase family protein [Myxococcota bacterium]